LVTRRPEFAYSNVVNALGKARLYVTDRDGHAVRRPIQNAYYPRFSPDGRTIAFTNERGVYLISSTAGSRKRIATWGTTWWDDAEGSRIAWSRDGQRIAVIMRDEGTILLLDLKTGRRERVRLPHPLCARPYRSCSDLDWYS